MLLSVCISWPGCESINQAPFWSFFPFSSSWSSKDILSLSIFPLLIMRVTAALRWMCLQPRAGLVSQIPLWCRQLHDFTHWSHSRRPRGCQPAMSSSVQEWLFSVHWHLKRWNAAKDTEAAYLWQEEKYREQAGGKLCLCVSPPPSSSIWRHWAGSEHVGEFAHLASHSLAHVCTRCVCHTLPQSTLMWSLAFGLYRTALSTVSDLWGKDRETRPLLNKAAQWASVSQPWFLQVWNLDVAEG